MSLQNLKEAFLFDLLPEGIVNLDERGLLEAVIGGIQDRAEDLRSYAKKYELFFDTSNTINNNRVVLVTFSTRYGKVVTRTLDIQHDTPSAEGDSLVTWAAGQMGVDESSISSCVFGEDLLRYVDINTLQYIAANVGAVLYTTAAQSGEAVTNQQRILDSYFPRLKIKGTIQSFDVLGRLLGFDDIQIIPLWGRLSPRYPSDFGSPTNDVDFAHTPQYLPQQTIGIAYDPYAMRDGPFYTWTGTVSADSSLEYYYPEAINGLQPWVKVSVTGTLVHPDIGYVATLENGGPHVKAYVLLDDYGLKFEALGEGDSFNGLQIQFDSWNSGTDRLITIQDRLSAIKYRTSYFDVATTVTDERAIAQFGTVAVKKSSDLASNPYLTSDGTALPPYRPWYSGSAAVDVIYSDYIYKVQDGPAQAVAGDPRLQATSAQTQFNVSGMQGAAVQYVQAMDDVKPATRHVRRVSTGWLNRDQAEYASYVESELLTVISGSSAQEGTADAIGKPYYVEFSADVNGTLLDVPAELDVMSASGSLVNFAYPSLLSGTFNRSTDSFRITPLSVSGTVMVYALYSPASTEVIRTFSGTDATTGYQHRPEDETGTATPFETVDEFPWRADLVHGGDLVEVKGHVSTALNEGQLNVDSLISVKDHTMAEYNLFGVPSTVEPIRFVSEARVTDKNYKPGQIAIGYSGGFKSLDVIPSGDFLLPGRESTDLDVYFTPGSQLYHVGLAQGVLVADLPKFVGPHHRDNLVGWLPLNEHPDEGAIALDRSSTASVQTVHGFNLTGSFADRKWSDERGWYLDITSHGTICAEDHRQIGEDYTLSFWINPEVSNSSSGTSPILQHGPVKIDLPDNRDELVLSVFNVMGTHHPIATLPIQSGTWNNVVVELTGATSYYGSAMLNGTLALSSSTNTLDYMGFDDTGDRLIISYGSNRGYGIQDLRVWDAVKSQAEIDLTHRYSPTATICTYWPSNVSVAGTGDRYGIKITPSGFAYLDKLPPAVRMNQLVRILHYDSEGRYHGEERLKEVGLSGGTVPPPVYVLGQQGYDMLATGTLVVSTSVGAMPGYNTLWNSVQNGTMALDPTANTNPCRSVIWLSGTDDKVYEVSLTNSAAGVELHGTLPASPTGAAVLLSNGVTKLACASNGNVFQTAFSGSVTPPLFMYANSYVTDDVLNAYDRWTGKSTPSAYGNKQTPPVAALDTNGQLEFENTSVLTAGNYRLSITSSNIGKADADFDGFSVEISIDDIIITGRLCQGKSGTDFIQTDVFEFKVTEDIPASWFMTVNWFNAYSNPSRGVARKLRIDGYKVERITSELFKVETTGTVGDQPSIIQQNTGTFSPETAGGWLAIINSYGTVCQWRHESEVYPSNDTVTSVVPISDMLTGNTHARKEDQYVSGYTGASVLVDTDGVPMPIFSSPTVS